MQSIQQLSDKTKDGLTQVLKWARFAAIISFINLALGLIQLAVGALLGDINLIGTVFSFLISAAITLVMSINLYNFSKHGYLAIETENSNQLSQAFYHLKIYFTVMGVLFLIILGLFLLLILIASVATVITLLTK